MEGQHNQVLPRLHLSREVADDCRIFQVAALRSLRHSQVMLDEQAERMTGDAVEPESARDSQGQLRADFGVVPARKRLAGVMEEQRQIEDEGPLELLK